MLCSKTGVESAIALRVQVQCMLLFDDGNGVC